MKLIHSVSIRISILATLVLSLWAVAFYFAIMEEINDETDDALEDYAETIIIRSLVGEELPTTSTGSNNQYFQREVNSRYAATHPHVRYEDRDIYIREKHEYEPARVLMYIYEDGDGRYHELEVSTPTIEKEDLRQAIFQWLLILFGSLLLGIILISIFSVHHTMRPLRKLLRWIEHFQIGKKNRPLDNPTRITEFRKLNKGVEESLLRSQQQYEQQKRFLGFAAHELQTPIAVCMNRMEMLLEEAEKEDTARAGADASKEEMARILHTLEHMSRLNTTLLTLYRIENGQYADRQQSDVKPLMTDILDDIQTVFASKHIQVYTEWNQPFVPNINPLLLRMLLTNMVKNAFVHNIDGGTVRIVAEKGVLTVANTGAAEPLDADSVFQPFVHTQGNAASTGLGLAVVKAICEHNSMRVDYRFDDPFHTFRLTLTAT